MPCSGDDAFYADDVRRILGREVFLAGSQRKWAERHDLTGAYVSDVLRGNREPGESILKALGLRKITLYVIDRRDTTDGEA